jgi:hypothetical protein
VRHLDRFFAARFHKTPQQWVRELRARLACKLLGQGWKTSAVAAELFFTDGSHLNREFRILYGVPCRAFMPCYGEPRPPNRAVKPWAPPAVDYWPSPSPSPSPAPRVLA